MPVPPAVPTSLATTPVSSTRIDLAWDAMDGATGYQVYRGGVLIASPSTNSYSDTGLTAATEYSYRVAAVNGFGSSAQCVAVTGTTPAAPSVDYALQFDGSQNSVRVAGSADFIQAAGTWEFWYKSTADSGYLMSQFDPHTSTGGGLSVSLVSGGWGGYICATAFLEDNSNQVYSIRRSNIDGAWHHVAVTWDGSQVYLWIDGQAEGSMLAAPFGRSDMFLELGKRSNIGDTYWPGVLDEVRISNVARYTANFVPLTNLGTDGNTVVYYKFNEGTGTVVADSSGQGHAGLLLGNPLPAWVPGVTG